MKTARRNNNNSKSTNEFSKVNFPELRKARKYIKKYGEKNYAEEMIKLYNKAIEGLSDKGERICEMQVIYMLSLLSGADTNVNNYFIESNELSSFLKNTKIKKEIISRIITVAEGIAVYDSKYKEYFDMDAKEFMGNAKHCIGCVHAKNIDRSFYFIIQFAGIDTVTIFIVSGDGNVYRCFVSEDFINHINQQENEIIRIVLNMLFYMNAFPDKILNSPPNECLDKLNCNNSKTITMSDEIRDYLYENRDVSPHLRRGHFRYLASDFYKNKKGQTVFVKSSFVKGHAKTIIE